MSFCTLTLAYFCVRSVFDPVLNFTKQNPPGIILKIESFTALNSFVGAVKTQKLIEFPFLFGLVAAVS